MVASLFNPQVNAALDENGNALNSHGDACARWRRYFLNVLNIPSSFDAEVVNSIVKLPVRDHLDVVPSYEEVYR